MADLVPAPDLDIRDEEQLAAEAIARVAGGLTVALIDSQIEARRKLRDLVASGTLAPPICPELTNANPSSAPTVLLEAQAWLLAFIARRINQLPKRDQIEFARLFKIELREAAPATAMIEFQVAPPVGVDVTIPAGTEVSTEDGVYVFATTAELVILWGQGSGQVSAERTVTGETILAPNTLTRLVDLVAWVDVVTNPGAVNSGSDDETVDEALERARSYQRRGERLVSTLDFEEAILHDVLLSRGVVRAFPFVAAGDFNSSSRVGHTTIVATGLEGSPITVETKQAINALLQQMVGNQFIYVIDPIYVDFDVTADVKLKAGVQATAVLAAVEKNLRDFYAATRENFGRPILRSEIIAVIEGTSGVDRIVSPLNGPILISPVEDVTIQPWELPRLISVALSAV